MFKRQKGKRLLQRVMAVFVIATILLAGLPDSAVYAQEITPVKPIVIVLDPGHGGGDAGAMRKWDGKLYREKDANLAIAKACKKKLESYTGVKVYLTRSKDNFVTLEGRVAFAKRNGADLFVALHNNASLSANTKGACVYYPNMNYNSKLGVRGKAVAQSIQNRLVALGLKNNGVLYRSSENNSKYPDKSLSDYYSVIRNCKSAGFPGLIVEHAYISNSSDCKKYLGSNKMLTQLGDADAMGIVNYYGLIPKTSVSLSKADVESGADALYEVQLQWTQAANVDGYCVYRRETGQSVYRCIKRIKGAQNLQYTDNTAIKGIDYEYGICGYRAAKNATTYTVLSNVENVYVPLPAPRNLHAQQGNDGTWTLLWDSAEGVSGYLIEQRNAGEDTFTQIAQIDAQDQTVFEVNTQEMTGTVEYRICSFYKDKKHNVTSKDYENVTVELPNDSSNAIF